MDLQTKTDLIKGLTKWSIACVPCGSRITCNPAPTDTDEDYLILLTEDQFTEFEDWLEATGWIRGSLEDYDQPKNPAHRFTSWTLEELNLILTVSEEFFHRHNSATNICQRLNLLNKSQRIMVFQAVLYGKIVYDN